MVSCSCIVQINYRDLVGQKENIFPQNPNIVNRVSELYYSVQHFSVLETHQRASHVIGVIY